MSTQARAYPVHRIYESQWYNVEAVYTGTKDSQGRFLWHLHADTADGPSYVVPMPKATATYHGFDRGNPQSSAERTRNRSTNQASFDVLKFKDFNVSWHLWSDLNPYDWDRLPHTSGADAGHGFDPWERSDSSWYTVLKDTLSP